MTDTTPDLVKLYNPANAASLSPQDIEALQKLDSDQIRLLAQAYPNLTMKRAYLLIIDSTKPADKQIPNLSTFQNLWNLREKNGQRKYVAYQYHGNFQPRNISTPKQRRQEVLDLSETDLMNLPGFKTADNGTMQGNFAAVTVPVTKVNRVAVKEVKVTDLTGNQAKSNFTINTKPTIPAKTETVSNPTIKQP